MMLPDSTVRDMVPRDLPWVMDSWLRSYRDHTTAKLTKSMPRIEYGRRWRRLVEALIARSRVVVLTPSFDEATILGWACVEAGAWLHYCHVKPEFQRFGVARTMFDATITRGPVLYSHRTTCWEKIHVPESWAYAPWLLIGA